jgi:integrase
MTPFLFQPSRKGFKSGYWSCRFRLKGWLKARTFALRVTDKRVAGQEAEKLLKEYEQDAAGIGVPRLLRDAAQTPIAGHLEAFLADMDAKGHARNTVTKYRNSVVLLCKRCKWTLVKDVTAQSFTAWRVDSHLRSKTLNDLLATMSRFMNWLLFRRYIVENSLKHAGTVKDRSPREFRRALLPVDAQGLLNVAPPHRAIVYLTILYTGLRSSEMKGLKWEDFDLEFDQPCVRVPSSISKNRKASIHGLHADLALALRKFRPLEAQPGDFVFRGLVPRVPTFKKDLAAAGIPFEDGHGRRIDIHALRKTFGTMLAVSGASLRTCMELMRHSESRLTEKVYTDASHLPLRAAVDKLPSLTLPANSLHNSLATVVSGQAGTSAGTSGRVKPFPQGTAYGVLGHKKAPSGSPRRLVELERAKRLELSTSTLARWCSTN